MSQLVVFFLKSVISSGILMGYYCLVLRNSKFHRYNRFYLLFTLLVSVTAPFLHFKIYSAPQSVLTNLEFFSYSASTDLKQNTSPGWLDPLLAVFFGVSIVML